MSFDRDGLEDRLDASDPRERLDDRVDAWAATIPTAGDDDYEPFDFGAWLREGRASGPTAPPAEPRVVTGVAETAEPTPADFESFDFAGWLSDGEGFEPVAALEPEADVASERRAEVEPRLDRPLLPRPTLHPVKAATFALFLSVVALVGLTVVGSLPAMGPAAGLGP